MPTARLNPRLRIDGTGMTRSARKPAPVEKAESMQDLAHRRRRPTPGASSSGTAASSWIMYSAYVEEVASSTVGIVDSTTLSGVPERPSQAIATSSVHAMTTTSSPSAQTLRTKSQRSASTRTTAIVVRTIRSRSTMVVDSCSAAG